jgi:hypothetical protein
MRKYKGFLFVIFFIFLSVPIFVQADNPDNKGQDELEKILEKCAEYCEKLTHSVLDFVCREKMTEEINKPVSRSTEVIRDLRGESPGLSSELKGGRESNTYVFDYQMIRKDGMITDRRILLRENGIKKFEVDVEPKIKRFKHHNILFGPIALLDLRWQPFYDYKIIEKGKFKRENVVVEYGFEKNGIRFPNKYSVVETYYRGGSVYFVRYRLDTTYKRYKFFTVKTEVNY